MDSVQHLQTMCFPKSLTQKAMILSSVGVGKDFMSSPSLHCR